MVLNNVKIDKSLNWKANFPSWHCWMRRPWQETQPSQFNLKLVLHVGSHAPQMHPLSLDFTDHLQSSRGLEWCSSSNWSVREEVGSGDGLWELYNQKSAIPPPILSSRLFKCLCSFAYLRGWRHGWSNGLEGWGHFQSSRGLEWFGGWVLTIRRFGRDLNEAQEGFELSKNGRRRWRADVMMRPRNMHESPTVSQERKVEGWHTGVLFINLRLGRTKITLDLSHYICEAGISN